MGDVTQNSIDNPRACGIGRGSECCIFLALGDDGFECLNNGSLESGLRKRHHAGKMNAGYAPSIARPECQKYSD